MAGIAHDAALERGTPWSVTRTGHPDQRRSKGHNLFLHPLDAMPPRWTNLGPRRDGRRSEGGGMDEGPRRLGRRDGSGFDSGFGPHVMKRMQRLIHSVSSGCPPWDSIPHSRPRFICCEKNVSNQGCSVCGRADLMYNFFLLMYNFLCKDLYILFLLPRWRGRGQRRW